MLAVGEHVLGEMDPQWVRMTTGFAGGIGRIRDDVCGALAGGVMVIGGAEGRASPDESADPAVDLAALFWERFSAEIGPTRCGPLRETLREPDGSVSCIGVVEQAATILLELLE
jgi:C_GCAxxG_C_C family probable redox protein